MTRFLTNLCLLAFLAVGVFSVGSLITNAPAFNSDLRRPNVFGQTILQTGSDMYDRPSYLLQQAVSYVRADLLPYTDENGNEAIAPVELVIERAQQGVDLMQESLSLNPGNAHGWTVMAWLKLYTGDLEGARDALRASWQLAPYNRMLAQERSDLALVMFDPQLSPLGETLPDEDRVAFQRDLETLHRNDRGAYNRLREDAEALGFEIISEEAES